MYPITLQDSFDHFYPPQQDMSGHEILSNHDVIVITLLNVKLVPVFIMICNSYMMMICNHSGQAILAFP